MKTSSLLVSFPAIPFTWRTLAPNRRLAGLASALEAEGHETGICDYGTLETLDRLFPGGYRSSAYDIADRFFSHRPAGPLAACAALWHLRKMNRAIRRREQRLIDEAARTIASRKPLHFVVIVIDSPEMLAGAAGLSARLREWAPSVRLVATGALIERHAESLRGVLSSFDCLCMGDPEWSLLQWAERLDHPGLWSFIPNLLWKYGGRKPERFGVSEFDDFAMPVYDAALYPALEPGAKLNLFDVEMARPCPGDGMPRARSTRAVCDEAGRIVSERGARALWFSGESPAASHVSAIGYEILARGLPIWYGCEGAVLQSRPGTFSALTASGCRAIVFDIASGSQRLASDCYGKMFGISEAETVLRASKSAGLYTVARFRYPGKDDDYHTRAETLRFISRARPDAVAILSAGDGEWPGNGRGWRQTRSALRAQAGLIREAAGLGVSVSVDAETALIARVLGHEGHEEDFAAASRRRFVTGDIQGIAAVMERFNHRTGASSNTVALRPYRPLLAAVGN